MPAIPPSPRDGGASLMNQGPLKGAVCKGSHLAVSTGLRLTPPGGAPTERAWKESVWTVPKLLNKGQKKQTVTICGPG